MVCGDGIYYRTYAVRETVWCDGVWRRHILHNIRGARDGVVWWCVETAYTTEHTRCARRCGVMVCGDGIYYTTYAVRETVWCGGVWRRHILQNIRGARDGVV